MLCTTTMRNAGSFSTFQPATDPGVSTMSFGVPNQPSADTANSAAPTKRGRDDGGGSSSPLPQPLQTAGVSYAATPLQQQHQMASPPPPPPQPPSSSDSASSVSSKRSRTSTYQAPREVRPSILTAMGSLVGGVHQSGSSTFVPQRRRLSGGFLDEFLGGHDNMDTDAADSRPRSMSF